MKKIYCVLGASGSGKTSLVNALSDIYGYKVVKSYSTRPNERKDGLKDHIYISEGEYEKLENKVATALFNGYHYCATEEQVDECDLYVVDYQGIVELKARYQGKKEIYVLYLDVNDDIRLKRMLERGDSVSKAYERIGHDLFAFRLYISHVIDAIVDADKSISELVENVHQIIKYSEEECERES